MQYYMSEDYSYLVVYLNRKTIWKLNDVSEEYETNLKTNLNITNMISYLGKY